MHHQQHYHQPPAQPPEQHIHQPGVLGENHDHNQILEQVIGLENDFSDNTHATSMMESDTIYTPSMDQHQHHHHPPQQPLQQQQQQASMPTDLNALANDVAGSGGLCSLGDSNQLSTSSEDLLNLLLEFDREPSAMLGIETDTQDEKVGIETIRKQLMGCEVQSDQQEQQHHHQQAQTTNSMSSIVNHQMNSCQSNQQQANITQQQQHQQQLVSQQSTPVIPSSIHQQHQQLQQTSIPSTSASQMNPDQSLLHGSYSNVSISPVPISSSGPSQQPQYHTTQQHQHAPRISQSNPMSIVSNSPSPSWQQPQLSPYSPHGQQQQQQHNNNTRTPSQRQSHPMHQNQAQQHQLQNLATSPQMQQLQQQTQPLQQRSPSQSVSPPATTEPSLVVKKNPLLNAQLINSRAPSITPTRFVNSQQTTTSVLNQNPILNAKLSQSPFVTNIPGTISSPVNPSLDPQARFMPQPQQPTPQQNPNFNYDMTQQQHQNAQQQRTSQQSVNVTLYGHSDQQQHQTTNQIFRSTSNLVNDGGGVDSLNAMGNTSPSGRLSQQVKQEIRKKVQQPKQQQHQPTSLLKQLLSDDNK